LKKWFILLLPGAATVILCLLLSCGSGPSPSLSVTASASPSEIRSGDSALLTWSSTGADRVEVSGVDGAHSSTGSVVVSPRETTTYLVTAFSASASVSSSVTVTVIEVEVPPPPPDLPEIISEWITVTWTLPDHYSDGSVISADNQALIVVQVYMSLSDAFDNTSVPVAVSSPGDTSVTFGPVDVTEGVEYFFATRSSLSAQLSVFSEAVHHVW
jgi:hypothetical protein